VSGFRAQVRAVYRRNIGETDPDKVTKQRTAAVLALHNFLMFQAKETATTGAAPFQPEDN